MPSQTPQVDVKPARTRGVVQYNQARVLATSDRVHVITSNKHESWAIDGFTHDRRRREWQAVTDPGTDHEGILIWSVSGGCTCGKPWMKRSWKDILAQQPALI